MQSRLSDERYKAALAAVDADGATEAEKVEMLMEIGMGLQQRPESPQDILYAVALYREAASRCDAETILWARVQARLGTALNAMPSDGSSESLQQAHAAFDAAIPVFRTHGSAEELAEAEMNLGLTLHALAGVGQARLSDAINAYLRSLRTFTADGFPSEFAILHNNLATAYLAMPATDQNSSMREALAVQSFEEALKVVTLVDQPTEYAMLQNNLGNALQYSSSSHAVENNLRALAAYDEALKVRTAHDTPLAYANTISNKANALRNLPDNVEEPAAGNVKHLRLASSYYQEARSIFQRFGEQERAQAATEALAELSAELRACESGMKDERS